MLEFGFFDGVGDGVPGGGVLNFGLDGGVPPGPRNPTPSLGAIF